MERRQFLAAGAAYASSMAFAHAAADAAAEPGPKTSGGSGQNGLKGDFLDLSTARGNREAFARILGNTNMRSTKFGWFKGMVHGVRPNEKIRDLVGFSGFSAAKLLPSEAGADPGYRKVLREVGFYTDLDTGEVLESWRNPYLDEQMRVVPIANDPFNHTITDFMIAPPKYGGLNKDVPQKVPLQLKWSRMGDLLMLESRINLFYPSALSPDKWPRENGNKFNQVSEMFLYQMRWSDMQNPALTSVEATGTWIRVTPWLPWMLMGPTPGHCMYSCFFGAADSLDNVDPNVIAYAEKNFPKYLQAPEKWEEPSLSSLEWYAREQKPASLPAVGKIPQAPPPPKF